MLSRHTAEDLHTRPVCASDSMHSGATLNCHDLYAGCAAQVGLNELKSAVGQACKHPGALPPQQNDMHIRSCSNTVCTLLPRWCHDSHGSRWRHGARACRGGWPRPRARSIGDHWPPRPKPCLILHSLVLLKLRYYLRWHISQFMFSMRKIASVAKMAPPLLPPAEAAWLLMLACFL